MTGDTLSLQVGRRREVGRRVGNAMVGRGETAMHIAKGKPG
jgi:hypothetical protein